MYKIAITGPESSGKTALAEALANKLNVGFSKEYAREYLMKKKGEYSFKDLDEIAKGQLINNQNYSEKDNYFICDTEMLVMKIWSEFKFKKSSDFIQNALINQKFDLYILCKPDFPWEDDPLRENPLDRVELYEIYLEELKKMNVRFIEVGGSLENRLEQCLKFL